MIGGRVKNLREELGLTQQALATRAKLGRSTVARLEGGKHSPTHDTLEAVARALGTSAAFLVGRIDEPDIDLDRMRVVQESFVMGAFQRLTVSLNQTIVAYADLQRQLHSLLAIEGWDAPDELPDDIYNRLKIPDVSKINLDGTLAARVLSERDRKRREGS